MTRSIRTNMTRIFISHSHLDRAIVNQLLNFLRNALPLEDQDIFCTSYSNGGMLFLSRSICDQIKTRLEDADALIAIITTESLRSSWIPFEIGSFWPTEKTIVLILGPSLTPSDLPGPLKYWPSIPIEDEHADERLNEVINQLDQRLDIRQNVNNSDRYRYLIEFINEFRDWNHDRFEDWRSNFPENEIDQLCRNFQEQWEQRGYENSDLIIQTIRNWAKSSPQDPPDLFLIQKLFATFIKHHNALQQINEQNLDQIKENIIYYLREDQEVLEYLINCKNQIINDNNNNYSSTKIREILEKICQSPISITWKNTYYQQEISKLKMMGLITLNRKYIRINSFYENHPGLERILVSLPEPTTIIDKIIILWKNKLLSYPLLFLLVISVPGFFIIRDYFSPSVFKLCRLSSQLLSCGEKDNFNFADNISDSQRPLDDNYQEQKWRKELAVKNGDYDKVIEKLSKVWEKHKDPSVQIALNNAEILSKLKNGDLSEDQVYAIAVVIPYGGGSPPFLARFILSGVARKQEEFNKNPSRKIFVLMADDKNPSR